MTTDDRTVEHIGARDADLAPGEKVGEYVVAEKIGAGGFGTVFRAEHPLIGKQAAIKVLSRQYSADPAMVSRFVAEARAVNQIRHRNIIDIFGFGQLEDGRHYYVMEYLDGLPLDEYLAQKGRLGLDEAIPILRAVARALDAAHAKGIAHRDLKPENVFLAMDEQGGAHPKLLDFGIAKLLTGGEAQPSFKTRTGAPMGTPYYMSPEQCRGRDVDHRTDVYAFGCMSYRVLTGAYPFDGADYMEILFKQINDPPPPPSRVAPGLPAAVDDCIGWMLQKDPAARPPDLRAAIDALVAAAGRAGVFVASETQDGVVAASGVRPAPARTPGARTPGARTPDAWSETSTADTMGADAVAASGAVPVTAAETGMGAQRRRGRLVLASALGLAVVAAAAAIVVASRGGGDERAAPSDDPAAPAAAMTGPVEPAPAPAAAAPPAEAAAPPEASRFVQFEVTGAPEGTEVYGPGGPVGTAPGTIQLVRGEEPLLLTFKAPGHRTETRQVVPSGDGSIEVPLEALERPARPARRGTARPVRKPRPRAGASDPLLEDPFPTP